MNILNLNSTEKENPEIISKLFNSLDIKEYEPSTINCMNEFIKSYIKNILKDAKKNMLLGKREKITIEDVESAVNRNQNNMYKNRSKISEMKFLADKVNSIDLPEILESPIIKKPSLDNNLLRNNFQIYSDELNQIFLENKNMAENTSLRVDDMIMLGNKRKVNFSNDSKNNLNYNGKLHKNKRKISLNQAFKKTSQENAKKEIENDNNKTIKINFAEPKKIANIQSNNINNNEDDIDFDNDEIDNTNNNIGESTLNKTLLNNISLKKDNEINIIGNKRKKSVDSKNYSNNKNIKKEKNKRKKSISQELKNSLQQKNKAIEKSMSSNSLSKDDDDLSLDDNDEIDDTNNNAGESTINKKENDDSDEDEDSEENENMNNNESNNNDNIGSSYSKNNNDED